MRDRVNLKIRITPYTSLHAKQCMVVFVSVKGEEAKEPGT
jgi:hypothetical protein